jgi:hypothetical protein
LTLCQLIVVASVMLREAQIIMYDDAIQMVPTRAQRKRRLSGYQCIKLIPFSWMSFYGLDPYNQIEKSISFQANYFPSDKLRRFMTLLYSLELIWV